MKLNVAFNVNFPHILLMFLLFILYLRYTNHMHKSWWKNEKMTNEISNENPEVTITPHPKKSLYVSKTSYNNQIYQKEGHLPEMSWTKSLRTHRRSIFSAEATNTLMDGWWADGWMGSWTNRAASRFSEFRDLKQKIRRWWITEGLWSPKTGLMKQTPPPVIQLQARVCARAGNSALCGTRGERENFTVALCCVHCSSAFPHVRFSTSCRPFFLLVSVHYTFPSFSLSCSC